METIKIPLHLKSAFHGALNSFSKEGFLYTCSEFTEDKDGNLLINIDANGPEMIKLGIKMGYIASQAYYEDLKGWGQQIINILENNNFKWDEIEEGKKLLRQ